MKPSSNRSFDQSSDDTRLKVPPNHLSPERKAAISRREFLGGTLAATAVASSLNPLRHVAAEAPTRVAGLPERKVMSDLFKHFERQFQNLSKKRAAGFRAPSDLPEKPHRRI